MSSGTARADTVPDPVTESAAVSQPHPALLSKLERARSAQSSQAATAPGSNLPASLEWLLRIPLSAKLVGANAMLFAVAAVTASLVRQDDPGTFPVVAVIVVAFIVGLLLNVTLVMLAMRPLRVLETTVDRIWHGDLTARVPPSLLSDKNATRVASMFNILLDGLVADRAHMRRLASQVVSAADDERAAMSRELHDSAAQSLAALVMQLSVCVQRSETAGGGALKDSIEGARQLATSTLEEVRLLAHTMHPRVLDDLGLVAALRRLARDNSEHAASGGAATASAPVIDVVALDGSDIAIPAPVRSVLYRVAQEAVGNARRHAAANHIQIRLDRDTDTVSIRIVDDGHGFDAGATRDDRTGIGLFTMRERVALVDGEFSIQSSASGTTVSAVVPLGDAHHAILPGRKS